MHGDKEFFHYYLLIIISALLAVGKLANLHLLVRRCVDWRRIELHTDVLP